MVGRLKTTLWSRGAKGEPERTFATTTRESRLCDCNNVLATQNCANNLVDVKIVQRYSVTTTNVLANQDCAELERDYYNVLDVKTVQR